MERIEFNEENHTYTINGVEYPSVTEICEPISFKKLDALSKQIIDNAARRGAKAHALISEYVMADEYDEAELTPEIFPYFKAFVEWWRTYRPVTLFSEFVLGSSVLGYCGTCDFIGKIDGKTVLIDFKTTSTIDRKYLAVQLAGYKRLLAVAGIEVDATYVLHLKKDGTYTYSEITPDNEWFDILQAHNIKMRSKNDRKRSNSL